MFIAETCCGSAWRTTCFLEHASTTISPLFSVKGQSVKPLESAADFHAKRLLRILQSNDINVKKSCIVYQFVLRCS